MSLDRYTNREEILETDGMVRGVEWNKNDYEALALDSVTVTLTDTAQFDTELHLYTPQTGDYIAGGSTNHVTLRDTKLYVDYANAIAEYGITRGPFEIAINIHSLIIGDEKNRNLLLKDISPDRRELLVVLAPNVNDDLISEFLEDYDDPFELDLALNFGENRIFRILNFKRWREDPQLAIRLYQPLPDDIELNTASWLVEQLSDPYVDNVDLSVTAPEPEFLQLRGPNLDIDANYTTITETDFKSWNQLLDTNLSTSQQIVDRLFSGSLAGVNLGIDYSNFDNFVFYSSAAERISNFKYKLELIEYYDDRINTIQVGSNTDAGALRDNVAIARKRRDAVIGGFDGFERWLYNEPTTSMFTHHEQYTDYRAEGGFINGVPYQIEPWPKFISASKYYLHDTTSTLGQNWFSGFHATASLYDTQNDTSLVKTIPEHIRTDANNDQYELFVNMIGHHFDVLYTYVDALSKTYHPEEHPKLGHSKEVLYQVAESLGWKLANGKQASDLWQYTLGVDSGSGGYAQTGSIFSKSDEEITTQVWRRIVNNLPYILKTRGTGRSIKALMNAYGIPQTLLSVREYGGPKVGEDVPALIEDRFNYALEINEDAHIIVPAETNTIRTREIRFKPAIKDDMALMSYHNGTNTKFHVAVLYTGSFSGSDSWGRIAIADDSGNSATEFLPLFDGEFWNLRWTTSAGDVNTVKVQKASDYITGKVIHSGSTENITEAIDGSSTAKIYIGGKLDTDVDAQINALSDTAVSTFSGSIQEYREWKETIDDNTFNLHTLNPSSYVAATDPTASYTTLHRHLPLGTDLDAIDYSSNGTKVMSKHPASGSATLHGGEATVNGFSSPENAERGNFEPVEETYYVQGVSLGANLPRSQKIRLEDNYLIRRLSPTNTGERSSFDYAPIDSNKLGLFYSHADQVNKDIFNHIGDIALDDYVGDPDDEYLDNYPDLERFGREYWKKFANKNDVNAFIRIFSQFDFALFNQIRQLLPERVDEAMGLIVEPHALERTKIKLTKKPTIENPQYDATVQEPIRILTGSLPMYSASISVTENRITAESLHQTVSGSNGYTEHPGNYVAFVSDVARTGSIGFGPKAIYETDALPGYTASLLSIEGIGPTATFTNEANIFTDNASPGVEGIPANSTLKFRFKFNELLVQTETIRDITVRIPNGASAVGALRLTFDLQYYDVTDNRYYTIASRSTSTPIGGGSDRELHYVTFKDIVVPPINEQMSILLTISNGTGTTRNLSVYFAELHHRIKRVTYSYIDKVIDVPRPSNIFLQTVYHYSGSDTLDDLARNNDHWISQSLGLFYSESSVQAAYYDDFIASTENPYYEGCKITCPAINVDSTIAALANKPVIEVYEANADQLIYTVSPEPIRGGNKLIIPPGNINVR